MHKDDRVHELFGHMKGWEADRFDAAHVWDAVKTKAPTLGLTPKLLNLNVNVDQVIAFAESDLTIRHDGTAWQPPEVP